MKLGVPKETAPREQRVALVPETVARLVKGGFEVVVESGAGTAAAFTDAAYTAAGAKIADARAVLADSDVVLKVDPPSLEQTKSLKSGAALISFLQAWNSPDLLAALNARQITAFSMEQIPRTTRAQPMDALSSQATIAGYKAVLLATEHLGRVLPMLVTAAGTLTPARCLVLGAGVAGLMAIGTAKRLGAIVEGFDVRAAAAEQVESMGAKFIGKELLSKSAEGQGGYAKELAADQEAKNRALIQKHAKDAHIVISAAAIPKKKAPILLPEETVRGMQTGAVIVDLSAETGGNCALTRAGEVVNANGVTVLGPIKLAATVPTHASQMYSRNVSSLLLHLVKEMKLALDLNDEITAGTCVTHGGNTRSAP